MRVSYDGKPCGPRFIHRGRLCHCNAFHTQPEAQAYYDLIVAYYKNLNLGYREGYIDPAMAENLDGPDGLYNGVACEMLPGAPPRPVEGAWASAIQYAGGGMKMKNTHGQEVSWQCEKPAAIWKDGIYYEILRGPYSPDSPCLVEGGVIDYVVGELQIIITAAPRSVFGPLNIWINGIEVNITSLTSHSLGHRPRFGVHFDIGLDLDVRYPESAVMCAGENTLEVAFHTYDMDKMKRLWIEYWLEQGKRPDTDTVPFGFINDMLTEDPELLKLHRTYLPIVVGDNLGLDGCEE